MDKNVMISPDGKSKVVFDSKLKSDKWVGSRRRIKIKTKSKED